MVEDANGTREKNVAEMQEFVFHLFFKFCILSSMVT